MSQEKITGLIESAVKILANNEKIAVPLLAVKLRQAAEANPYDQTIVAMMKIVSKFEDNNKLLISKGELKDLYNKLYTKDTKFADIFESELGEMNNLALPKFASKYEEPIVDAYKSVADPILSNALASAFDKNVPLKLFSKELANKATIAVGSNLDAWNLRASKLDVESGNEHFIVVKADYDTPKGLTSILVPVEVSKNKITEPSVFMGNNGPQELNHVNIKAYISTQAGAKLNVRANDVIDVLTNAITEKKDVSEVQLALTRVNAKKETAVPFFADAVLNQEVSNPQNVEVVLPKLGEFNTFAEKFESPLGFANFKFGVDKVNLGRDVIVRTLTEFGIKAPQINVINADDTSVIYAVSLHGGRVAFNVPVKFANNRVINPNLIICNGNVYPFSKNSIHKIAVSNETDYKAAAVTSPVYGLKPSELIDTVRTAMSEGNYAKAEDALNILMQSGDDKAYKTAFVAFSNGLSMKKTASENEVKCSMAMPSANSKHLICGHTGLPLHKVCQDKFGNCQPLYRKGMDETQTAAAYFMNAKIFG